jgi:cytochrome c biogenesis factor
VWLGGLFMVLGGVLAVSDRRYRLTQRKAVGDAAVATSI